MVETELSIKPAFVEALPKLSDDEFTQLESNIVADGRVHDPIIYWHHAGKNWIVDGMNRYRIAKKHGIAFRTEPREFADEKAAIVWIRLHQLGKRNLTPDAAKLLRGYAYNDLKRDDSGHGDQKSGGQNVRPIRESAAKTVSKVSGVDERTVRRDGKLVAQIESLVDPLKKVVTADKLPAAALVDKLSKADETTQQQIARDVRTGKAKDVATAAAAHGIKAGTSKTDKPKQTSESQEKSKDECIKGGKHEWESDGDGARYCVKCSEDHPSNPKPGKEPDWKILKRKLDKTLAAAQRAADDLHEARANRSLHDRMIKDLKALRTGLAQWN